MSRYGPIIEVFEVEGTREQRLVRQNPPSPPRRQVPPSGQSPPKLITRPDPDPSEFSRALRLLGSSYAPRAAAKSSKPHHHDASQYRQLFDLRKHDPVSFSAAQARKPVPKSSGDHGSMSSASSYTHSVISSSFTLSSSTTDGSSTSSSFFDHTSRDELKTNTFFNQLKKLYCDILPLESKVLVDLGKPKMRPISSSRATHRQEPKKRRRCNGRRQRKATSGKPSPFLSSLCRLTLSPSLSKLMLNLSEISLAPGILDSLRRIPEKYNIYHLSLDQLFLSTASWRTCGILLSLPRLPLNINIFKYLFTTCTLSTQHSSNKMRFWTLVPIGSGLLGISRDIALSPEKDHRWRIARDYRL